MDGLIKKLEGKLEEAPVAGALAMPRRSMRNTRASIGVGTTCSTAGVTVPLACSVASTVPRSTRAI